MKKLAASSDGTGSLGSDKTALLTAGSVSPRRGRVTDVLMVTTTVGMLDGVHGDTSDSGPVSLLGVRAVVAGVGAEHGLVGSLAAGANANHSSAASEDGLTDAGGQSHARLLAILRVADHDSGSAGGTGESATVAQLGLNVGDDGALWHLVDGENVADSERSY